MKILTTAIFAVFMLGKKLTSRQWISLLILLVGVCVVQLTIKSTKKNATYESELEQNYLLGFLAVIASCLMSGFAGVYTEKILKGSSQSLWVRNVQLSFFSICFGIIALFSFNADAVVNGDGFFQGYDWVVGGVVLMQSLGGLLVAVVVKYTDNILKGFATSASIMLSCVASMYLSDFELSWQFVTGASLVMSSIYAYSKYAAKPETPLPKPISV